MTNISKEKRAQGLSAVGPWWPPPRDREFDPLRFFHQMPGCVWRQTFRGLSQTPSYAHAAKDQCTVLCPRSQWVPWAFCTSWRSRLAGIKIQENYVCFIYYQGLCSSKVRKEQTNKQPTLQRCQSVKPSQAQEMRSSGHRSPCKPQP